MLLLLVNRGFFLVLHDDAPHSQNAGQACMCVSAPLRGLAAFLTRLAARVSLLVRLDVRIFRVKVATPFAQPLGTLVVLLETRTRRPLQLKRPPATAHGAPGLAPAIVHFVVTEVTLRGEIRHLDVVPVGVRTRSLFTPLKVTFSILRTLSERVPSHLSPDNNPEG